MYSATWVESRDLFPSPRLVHTVSHPCRRHTRRLVPYEASGYVADGTAEAYGGSTGACSRGNFKAPETIVRQRSRVFLAYLESTGAFRGGGRGKVPTNIHLPLWLPRRCTLSLVFFFLFSFLSFSLLSFSLLLSTKRRKRKGVKWNGEEERGGRERKREGEESIKLHTAGKERARLSCRAGTVERKKGWRTVTEMKNKMLCVMHLARRAVHVYAARVTCGPAREKAEPVGKKEDSLVFTSSLSRLTPVHRLAHKVRGSLDEARDN